MDTVNPELVAAVYGEFYASAQTEMALIQSAINNQKGKGFNTEEECAKWAHEHLLDLVAAGKAQHQFYNLTHFGEPLILSAWKRYYCDDVLFLWIHKSEQEVVAVPWIPKGIDYFNRAKIVGERHDGIRQPLNHRDYFVPTGYFDKVTETFNVAKPFPAFAKETGRDTSHIYTFIENIAGECKDHLLAWLRFKIMYPKKKTEVVPVIVSRTQGNGKTTFAEVICKGLFGFDNVLVTNQYDANSRFNADYADALVVCAEEKEEDDKRASAAALKSRATGTTIRKEHKGVDPIYQESYTEYVITTNKDVPIKFDGSEDQRRFMVMGSNSKFTREKSPTADEVFSKLYGMDKDGHKVGTPFVEDKELIAQFKHELFQSKELAQINLHQFPHTAEYQRCFSLPRTSESTEIDSILRTLAPFIKQSLIEKRVVPQVKATDSEEILSLASFLTTTTALYYSPGISEQVPPFVALCRPLVFYDNQTGKPFNHATVERGILDCVPWLLGDWGIRLMPSQLPLPGGFPNVMSRYRQAPAARFVLAKEEDTVDIKPLTSVTIMTHNREGARLRVNAQWKPDPNGEFETLNEMKPGVNSLANKSENVAYLDNFLFEADDTSKQTYLIEQTRLKGTTVKKAEVIYMERLRLQRAESDRLLNDGIAWRVVYSGGKSYHILVQIKDAPTNLDEYKWLHAHLCEGVISKKLEFDPTCNDPARLTRAPITRDRTSMYNGASLIGTQGLYRELPGQILDYNWRPMYNEWLNRPLEPWEAHGKKLRPAKQEYKDAMWALLNGTFFTDGGWNGRRQQCFFPAYRLCRLVGYSHDQLWADGGILDGLDRYYRKNEIDYWTSRENSDIIKQIDTDVEEQLAHEEGSE
jgi:hypothetical protein